MSSRMNSGENLAHGNGSQQVQEDTINIGPNNFINDPVIDGSSHKRVRGPTYMPSIWAREEGDRIPVEFNEYGQPIDKETTNSLSHFMGSLARSGKYCPVDKAWHQVKATKKGMLLNFLETKFDLPPGSDDWILKSFAKKVRNWRARIKKDYYDPSLSLQEQIKSKPKRVRPDQWNNLIKNWNKEEAKKISERNKTSRGYKKMVQVTVEDAIGATIAWPCPFTLVVHDED